MMLIQRFKETITTLIGLALLAGAGILLYIGKITMGEFSAFLPTCLALFWAKNSFITDFTKMLGKGGAAVLLVSLLLLTGCRATRSPMPPVLPSVTNSSSVNTTSSGGETQQGYTKPDSASITLTVNCDSLGNVYLEQIRDLKLGKNVKTQVQVKDHYIILKCTVDSAAVWSKWSKFAEVKTDTLSVTKYLPGTTTNILTWWEKLMIKCGYILGGLALLTGAYFLYKLKP